MAILGRHRVLLTISIVCTVALVGVYTLLQAPVYEATSVVRFELEQVNLPQLVQQLSTENRISTEIEVLRGRTAAVAVIDSLGLRARLKTSALDSLGALVRLHRPHRARASELFSVLQVPAATDTLTLVVRSQTDSTFAIWRPEWARETARARVGDTVHVGGVTLALTSAALLVPELRLQIVSVDEAVRSFGSALNVSRPARDADLIAIRVRLGDPVLAAAAANLLAQHLIAGRQGVRQARTGSTIGYLRQQLDTLGVRLRTAEDSLRAYRERASVVDVAEQARSQVGSLARVQAERGAVQAEREALATTLRQMRSEPASAADEGRTRSRRLISFPTLFRLQAASQLLGSLAQVENERSALLVRRTPQDPDVQVLTARIREFDSQLESIAEDYLRGLTNTVTELDREAGRNRRELDRLPEKEVRAARLDREVKLQQELYTLFQTRLKEAEITQAMEDPTVRVVDPASLPARPWRPRPMVNLALALVLGSLFGVSVSLGRELSDRSIRSRADALLAGGLPVLGAIPHAQHGLTRSLPRLRRHNPPVTTAALVWPGATAGAVGPGTGLAAAGIASLLVSRKGASAVYAEAFNQLYANLALAYRNRRLKVVVFTSPLPGEGKTLSVINFALTLAARGRRILLIDADLRCGLVSAVFGCASRVGFAEVLQGKAEFGEGLWRTAVGEKGELAILPAGVLTPTPGRGLDVERVREVLEALAPQFDLVLVDTPPVNVLADAALLGAAADAVVLVVRAGRTEAEALRFALEQLTAAGAPVAGTLLNDVDPSQDNGDGHYKYLAEVERYYAGRA